ncbi:hypothetical protein [Microbacterium paludicola]|uniref:hypothetical protein n=1 Tax=Microbacterium paludicola TaxID=300019 RepID=UPI0031E3C248
MNWLDTSAAVVEALATALAVGAAIYAGLYAKRTYETQARQLEHAREQSNFERDQHARHEAAGLASWWVSCEVPSRWGVIVSNTSPAPFFDVRVYPSGNSVAKSKGDGSFLMTVVPPGTYFVESLSAAAEAEQAEKWAGKPRSPGWHVGAQLEDGTELEPLLAAHKYRIDRMTFRDNAGQTWQWTPETGTAAAA